VIRNLFDYRDDEDKGLKSMTQDMINHLVKTLDYYGKEGEIEDHV